MPNILELNQTIRHVRRYAEIVHVLARYGFADVVQELGLDRLLERGMAAVGAGKLAPEFEHLPRAARLRQAMEELGPTFVKLGQLLSTRRDLVPQEWADEFTKLQDNVPPVPFGQIAEVLKAEFGQRQAELFKEIEHEPIGSASMAQVHRAVLADGTSIVLKILRPGIREVTQTDMEVMRTLAEFAEARLSNLGYSPIEVVNEFARELEREVDLRHEGRSTERLRRQFVLDESVSFPKVYWEATTGSVLALEEIRGVLLSRLKEGDLTPEEQRLVVANGAKAVLRMCLDIGFFHADPHPGNLFAMPGGKVCFIDCGMTGQLDETTTYQLADLVLGVVQADSEKVLGVVADLADVDPIKLEDRGLRSDVRDFIAHFQNTPLDQLNMADLLEEFFQKLRAHHLRCPGDLVLLIKALATIEACCSRRSRSTTPRRPSSSRGRTTRSRRARTAATSRRRSRSSSSPSRTCGASRRATGPRCTRSLSRRSTSPRRWRRGASSSGSSCRPRRGWSTSPPTCARARRRSGCSARSAPSSRSRSPRPSRARRGPT